MKQFKQCVNSDIPTVDELETASLSHTMDDHFNLPGLTNFYASIQVARDITAIRSFTSPPLSTGEVGTGYLYIDGEYLASTGKAIEYRWRPDRIKREVRHKGMIYRSSTFIPPESTAAVVKLEIENCTDFRKSYSLSLRLRGGVSRKDQAWNDAIPPSEADNALSMDQEQGTLLFQSRNGEAFSLQGGVPAADRIDQYGLHYDLTIQPNETFSIYYLNVLGEEKPEVKSNYGCLQSEVRDLSQDTKRFWNEEIAAVFDPNSDQYSGYLPVLSTDNEDLHRLYYTSIIGTVYHKRLWPEERSYITLMPRYWQTTTFLWDISLSSSLFSMLDPEFLRTYIEDCLRVDIHDHHSIENMSGGGAGPWYSVNDFALLKMIRAYLKYNGDFEWLRKEIRGKSILNHTVELATHWQNLDNNDHGLADYGEVGNLLECVYSYTHEVASLNAANIFNLRFVANLLEEHDRTNQAEKLLEQAEELLQEVQSLYVSGGGYWSCKQPDGKEQQVRHCYDFLTILETIPEDLSQQQQEEMTEFFREELRSPTWLHALSPKDQDAVSSRRPDHQWLGAYTAWPALCFRGLQKLDQTELATDWIQNLAKTAKQGPFGQAHVVQTAMKEEAGGARKAPSDPPYICDWACVSNGSYYDMVLESLFGVSASLFQGVQADPTIHFLDDEAELTGIRYRDERLLVDQDGLKDNF